MRRERDTQKARVYRSDKALVAIAKPLPTVRDMQRFVDRIWSQRRVYRWFGPDAFRGHWRRKLSGRASTAPLVHDGRGRRAAGGWSRGITMPLWSRNEAIVLHELAHSMCARLHGPRVAGHGWQYCSIYLRLVLYGMGREAHDTLKAAFKANRVRFREPRKRAPLSPERKAELAARLATYRESRIAA